MKAELDLEEVVLDLNYQLFDNTRDTEHNFSLSTTGYAQIISFDDQILWSSEDDTREWIDEEDDYEPFLPFIKRVWNEYIEKLQTFKLK